MWYTGVQLVDMDDDGQPEVLIGNRDTSSLEIWRYDPDLDTLVQIDSIGFPYHVHDMKAADFDSDGDMDVAVGLRFEGLYFATNTGAPGTVGSWSVRAIDGAYSWQVLVEDFDHDDNLDIADGVDYGPIYMFYGDGDGNFVQGASAQDPTTEMRNTRGFNAVDLDGDDRLDLIGVDGAFVRALLNPGNRTDAWVSVGPAEPIGDYPCCEVFQLESATSPSAGDLDGNGYVDQVAFLGTPAYPGPVDLLLFKGGASGSALNWTKVVFDTITNPSFAGHIGVADVDGDGYLDIHVGGGDWFDGLRVYLGDGRGGYTLETVSLDHGVGSFNTFAVGDLNGDGRPDIIASRHTSSGAEYSGFEVLFGVERNPPEANADTYVTRRGIMLRVPAPGVLGNDFDADSEPLTAVMVTKPAHGWLSLDPDGSFVYFPDYGFTGEDSFTYRATDGADESAAADVTVYVWPNPHLARLMAVFR